jgi:hypothetical protein
LKRPSGLRLPDRHDEWVWLATILFSLMTAGLMLAVPAAWQSGSS